jgi:hypothetical protein
MPDNWQKKFVKLLEELDEKSDELPDLPNSFSVKAKKNNKFIRDEYANYDRGRRQVFEEYKE